MAAKSKRVDPIKQREKRAKIAAAIGGVLFLAVAAYEVPTIMKSLNQKPPPGANATDAGNRNPDGSIPLPNVAATASTGLTGKGELADTDVPPPSQSGQLVSFSVFQTKNPFIPQVTVSSPTSGSTAPAPTTANKPGADVPPTQTTTTPTQTTTTPTTTTSVVPTSTTPVAAPPPTVAISVNGVVSHVAEQETFPTSAPVFRLVSFDATSAQIGIVGGSYATGDQTLTLQLNQPVTLENQTDGKRYTVDLVSTH